MHYGCPKDDEGKPLTGKAFLDHKAKTKRDNLERSKRTGQPLEDQTDEELELEEDTKLPASQGSHPVKCLSSEGKTSSVEATQPSATAVAALPSQPKTIAASNPSDSSLSETDVPEMQIPWTLEDQRTRDFLMHLHNIPLLLSGCCKKDFKMQITVMEDVVKLAEGIMNDRWYLCEDLDDKIAQFGRLKTHEERLAYVPELYGCVKENISHMESKTTFSDSSESDKETRRKKTVPNPADQSEVEKMERRRLAEKEAKVVRMKEKKKKRNHKVAARARLAALALVRETVPAKFPAKYTVQDPGQEDPKIFFAKALTYLRQSSCDLVLACLDKNTVAEGGK